MRVEGVLQEGFWTNAAMLDPETYVRLARERNLLN